jgi:hypothetical protein
MAGLNIKGSGRATQSPRFGLNMAADGSRGKGAVLPFPRCLEHDPEKWDPVFGQDHAQPKRPG